MEMVDLVFINKVDDNNLKAARIHRAELIQALQFQQPKEKDWTVPVLLGSALYNEGLNEIFDKIVEFIELKIKTGRLEEVRKQQAQKRFEYWVHEYIVNAAKSTSELEEQYECHKKNASELKSNPSSEAKLFVEQLLQKKI
jgi:LAO/AO transport system kinase